MADSQHVLTDPPPPADIRLRYGNDPNQFGDLRIPRTPRAKGPHPVAMMIHGGFWRAKYDLLHAGHLCAALTKAGVTTWNLEYRRVGNPGGGWPGTFEDVSSGFAFLRQASKQHNLDENKIMVLGHSAGGELALCLAAHQRSLRGALSLAGVVDLHRAWELHLSNDAVVEFLGGTPEKVPEHYHEASPAEASIAGVPQILIHGAKDDIVPVEMSRSYRALKKKRGEDVQLVEIADAGHFELIDPQSTAWATVQAAVLKLLA
jgi:acetyl esterase/lipase